MGDYSYSEHMEMFGGPPEPGEAYPDLEQVDLARKAAKEDGTPFAWSAVDLGEPVVVESGHEAAVRKGMAPTYMPAPDNERTRTQIVAAKLIARFRRRA